MRFPENISSGSTSLFIDEQKSSTHHGSRSEHGSRSINRPSSPPSEYIYTEIVKSIGNNEFIKEKSFLKRVSWSPLGQHEYGLPPTGKRSDGLYATLNKPSHRVRMRPQASKPIPSLHNLLLRPVSFNEKYDRSFLDRFTNQSSNPYASLPKSHHESSPAPSLSSIDAALPIATCTSPSFDNSDFISDTSSISSMTTSNTTTSIPSVVYSRRKTPHLDRVYPTRPVANEYQQHTLKYSNQKFATPVLKTTNITLSDPMSSLRSATSSLSSSSSSSSSLAPFTCSKGHEQSSPSLIGSSLNQQAKFTTQTSTIDSSREDIGHPSTTTHSLMTMSISPNRHHHHQTYSTNPLNTASHSVTKANDGFKQQHDQIDSTLHGSSCLKSRKTSHSRAKKSVHFDRQLPSESRPPLPSIRGNYQLPVTLTSSCICNRTSDNDEQKEKNHRETLEEKEKNEMTRRTLLGSPTPLTTHTIHRSFSLSPALPSAKEKNDSRTARQEKKENVDELNCTTSRQVTTAATHLYYTPHTTVVTYKEGSYDTSPTKEFNGTNNLSPSENVTHSTTEKQMPSTSSLAKTSTPSTTTTTTKKFIGTGGFFNFITRSNSNHNKSTASDECRQLKRTASTQRRPKQYISHENKRLSADIEPLHTSSISLSNAWRADIDKVPPSTGQKERQATREHYAIHNHTTTNTDPSCSHIHTNRSSISLLTKPATTMVKSYERDSLNNGLLFQPVQSGKRDSFFLSPSNSFSHTDASSSMGKMMQTSTLVISTPPQYHYYLYPPASSSSKKNVANNRTISNVSMNSISTNSSSSSSSYDSQFHDLDDDTSSYSAYQNKIYQSGSCSDTKPVILSDSVQAFWLPQSSALSNNDPEQIQPVPTVEQNKHSSLIKYKQSEAQTMPSNVISSTCADDSSARGNGNQTAGSPPSTSSLLNNEEEEQEAQSYAEQNVFHNASLRIAPDTSFEDTQASYSERLREKSRSITSNRALTMNVNPSSLSRSRSKDTLHNQTEDATVTTQQTVLRPKSAGQTRVQAVFSPVALDITNDFQSKRQFFENRIYTDNSHVTTNNKVYTLPPTSHQPQQRYATKQPPSSESVIRTTKYFDSPTSQALLPPAVSRKPVRIVKAVQRSVVSPPANESQLPSSYSCSSKMNSTSDLSTVAMSSSHEPISNNDHHLSSEYVRNLFPTPDHQKRNRSRQNSSTATTTSHEHVAQNDDLLLNLSKRLEILKENQRTIIDEIEINTKLGSQLMHIIESKGEANEIDKLKLHINEIDTITSVLLKLSARLAKVENDLLMITNDQDQMKASLLDRREKIQEKHDEAKSLKDGIDRRSRLVTNILQKYLSTEQCDDYDHFIRMKSTLLIDGKDIEENIALIEKQIQLFHSPSSRVHNQLHSSVSLLDNLQGSNTISSSTSTHLDNLQANYSNAISSTA